MKIVHFSSGDIWAGAEKQLYTLAVELAADDSLELTVVLMNHGELADRLTDAGVRTVIYDEKNTGSIVIFFKILFFLRSRRPDIIHTHGLKENILAGIANLLSAQAINVRTVHGAPETLPAGLKQIHKIILRKLDIFAGRNLCNRIIAVTGELKSRLSHSYDSQKIITIVNGIDTRNINRTTRRPSRDKFQIGIAGRLYPVKRLDIFLEIARRLSESHPGSYRFHVIGDGPQASQVRELVHEFQLDRDVIMHGHREDMEQALAELDLLVICSDHEGMPMVALESVVAGTPVMAHAVGGLKLLLAGHADELLVEENKPETYCEKIEKLQNSTIDIVVRSLQQLVEADFSAAANAKSTAQLYRDLL